MRILAPHDSEKFQGGGSTFIKNFKKAINKFGHQVVTDGEYDILFISGATLVDKEAVRKAKNDGKRIVLRVDNILEDRKNRNSGMTKLREYADLCDVIVYQSEWAKRLLSPLLGNGIVIHNGVDTDIFYPRTEKKDWENIRVFYSKYSRNEVKQFHEVQYWWREYNLNEPLDTLVLVGRFADDYLHIDHPFDFHNEEQYEFKGVIQDDSKLAEILRGCDIAFLPYMFDACSNTVIEAQACGLPVIYSPTGGTPEIVMNGIEMDYGFGASNSVHVALATAKQNPFDFEEFKNRFSLDTMAERYDALFKIISGNEYDI